MKKTIRMKSPDDATVAAVGGVEYEGNKGFFNVAPAHVEVLKKRPFNFRVVELDEETRREDDGDPVEFDKMSKAELIDFIKERNGEADRKMSKEQLVATAEALKDVEPEEE